MTKCKSWDQNITEDELHEISNSLDGGDSSDGIDLFKRHPWFLPENWEIASFYYALGKKHGRKEKEN
jgi:hypothetical protein